MDGPFMNVHSKFEFDKRLAPSLAIDGEGHLCKNQLSNSSSYKIEVEKKMHLCVMPFFDNFHSFEGVICWKFA